MSESQASQKLAWPPPDHPDFDGYVERSVSNDERNLQLEADSDYRIVCSEEITDGGLVIRGGRNVVFLGLALELGDDVGNQDPVGLELSGQTGIVHIEGAHIHGPGVVRGIVFDGSEAQRLQVENCRVVVQQATGSPTAESKVKILDLVGSNPGLSVGIDRFTGRTDGYGLWFAPSTGSSPDEIDLRRTNIDRLSERKSRESPDWLIYQSGREHERTRISFEDVWLDAADAPYEAVFRELSDGPYEAAVEEYRVARLRYEALGVILEMRLKKLCEDAGVYFDHVASRPKSVSGVRSKLRKRWSADYRDVPDLCGVRIVLCEQRDVDRVVALLQQFFRDARVQRHGPTSATEIAYESTHVDLRISDGDLTGPDGFVGLRAEVQVRTLFDHAWAVISHRLDYKGATVMPEQLRGRLYEIRSTLSGLDRAVEELFVAMSDLRRHYSREVESGRHGDLDLDREALIAASTVLPLKRVRAQAEALGLPVDPYDTDEPAAASQALTRFVAVGTAAGLRTLRDVEDLANSIERHHPTLERAVEALRQEVAVLPGNPWDLMSMTLLVTHDASVEDDFRFEPAVMGALERIRADSDT